MYVISWAFLMTSVSRVFMKFFVSKKEETVLILSTAEEISGKTDEERDDVLKEGENERVKKDPYFFGEALLVLIGICLVVIGIAPSYTVEKIADVIDQFFRITQSVERITYYSMNGLVVFVVAAILAIFIYVNLVHGVLLRAIRNKKNKELQERME